jgi:hypothetical protein
VIPRVSGGFPGAERPAPRPASEFVLGVVLTGLGVFVLSYGSWWALAFWVAAAADFSLGYRIYPRTESQPPS